MNKENPDKNNNSSPIASEVSYGFSLIFSIYLAQSLIYIVITLIGKNYPELFTEDRTMWFSLIYFISCLGLYIGFKKYNDNYDNPKCVFYLFALFFAFKISFFIAVFGSFLGGFSEELNVDVGTGFLFYNITVIAIYLTLIIYCKKIKEVSLLISFGVGFLIIIISFALLYFFSGVELAAFVLTYALFEIIFLLVSIKVAQKSDILEEGNPIHNSLMVDYYKFFVFMIFNFICIMIFLLMVACSCYIITHLLPTATYSDEHGNIYDQYGSKMGLKLTKKPAYMKNGKFYDRHGNEISEESSCQIF
jgi:hypothetical protein